MLTVELQAATDGVINSLYAIVNVGTMYARDDHWRAIRKGGSGGASSSNWRKDCHGAVSSAESEDYSWRRRPSNYIDGVMLHRSRIKYKNPIVEKCDGLLSNDKRQLSPPPPPPSSSQDLMSKAANDFNGASMTYASILKKPIEQALNCSAASVSAKTKAMDSELPKMSVHCHHIRFGSPEPDKVSDVRSSMSNENFSLKVCRKAAQNKFDYLKELLGASSRQPATSLDMDDGKSTVDVHLVNGKGRPQPGCNNSLIALIMGFGIADDDDDGDDGDDDATDEGADDGWDVVDRGSSNTLPSCDSDMHLEKNVTEDCADVIFQSHESTNSVDEEPIRFYSGFGEIELADANLRWQQAYGGLADYVEKPSNKKVSFADDEDLETVHSASPECRKSPWEEVARDRHRFQRRIHETGLILDRILGADHRHNVYANEIAPYVDSVG